MTRYCFNWTITGSTLIDADTLAAAREKWDAMGVNELYESADQSDFCEDEVLVETAPNVFDEVEEEAGR